MYVCVGHSVSSCAEVFWGLKGERSSGIVGKVKRNEKRYLDLRPMGDRGAKEIIFCVRRILPLVMMGTGWQEGMMDGKPREKGPEGRKQGQR